MQGFNNYKKTLHLKYLICNSALYARHSMLLSCSCSHDLNPKWLSVSSKNFFLNIHVYVEITLKWNFMFHYEVLNPEFSQYIFNTVIPLLKYTSNFWYSNIIKTICLVIFMTIGTLCDPKNIIWPLFNVTDADLCWRTYTTDMFHLS